MASDEEGDKRDLRFLDERLAALDPRPDEIPSPEEAYARFRAAAEGPDAPRPAEATPVADSSKTGSSQIRRLNPRGLPTQINGYRRFAMLSHRRARRLVGAAVAVAAALVFVVSYAPARQVLADFLQIFRVREVSVVQIDPARLEQLKGAAALLHDSSVVQFTAERPPQKPEPVANAEEASSRAGFRVKVPTGNSAEFTLRDFSVMQGPAVRVRFDRELLQERLAQAGLGEVELPDFPGEGARVDIPMVVRQLYEFRRGSADTARVEVVQLESPTLSLPAGVDPRALGQTYLRLLGLPPEEADRLAGRIDWTGTLVLPMPKSLAHVQEIEVNGHNAVLLESNPQPPENRRHRMMLWQDGGVLYAVSGVRVAREELGRLAESLR